MRLACPQCRFDAKPIVQDENAIYLCPECGTQGKACWLRPIPSMGRMAVVACGPTVLGCVTAILIVQLNNGWLDWLFWPAALCGIGGVWAPLFLGLAITMLPYERVSITRTAVVAALALLVNVCVALCSVVAVGKIGYGFWRLW